MHLEKEGKKLVTLGKSETKVTLILAQQFYNCYYFLNLLKGVDFISFAREFHTFGP